MDTSRAKINIFDNSNTVVEETTNVVGFTVVKAEKGARTPVKVSKNAVAKLKDIFGVSSKDYPEMYEVETFNSEYDVYVSAPYESAKVPAAYITGKGIFASKNLVDYNDEMEEIIFNGVDPEEKQIEGFTKFTSTEIKEDTRYPKSSGIGGTDVDLTQWAYPSYFYDGTKGRIIISTGMTKSEFGEASNDSFIRTNFVIEGMSYSGSLIIENSTDGKINQTINGSAKQVGSLGYLKTSETTTTWTEYSAMESTDIVQLSIYGTDEANYIQQSDIVKNWDEEAERAKLKTYWTRSISGEEIFGVIIPKYPSSRALNMSFTEFSKLTGYKANDIDSRNIIKMSVYEDNAFHNSSNKISITGSIDTSAVDGNGGHIGFTEKNSSYYNQELIYVYPRQKFTSTTQFDTSITKYVPVLLEGGVRSFVPSNETEEDEVQLHNYGWSKAGESEYSEVDVFFDSALHDFNGDFKNSTFFGLATDDVASHELAGYIFNYTYPESDLKVDIDNETSLINNKLTFGRNYWNVGNILVVADNKSGEKFKVAFTGARAAMQCRIIENKNGGVAPMWENAGSPGMGGQLSATNGLRLVYKYNKKELDVLDTLNYNPIVNDRQFGFMLTSQKTCKDGDTTDWSYIGHASAFLKFLKEVRENVMIPQIGKANNPYYRNLRKEQVQTLLDRRLKGNDRIWAEASVDTSTADGVNDVYALKARKFVINVKVKVDVFSETVELNFSNTDQDTTISVSE